MNISRKSFNIIIQIIKGINEYLDHLPLDIKKLCDKQRPVEGQLHHVVPPDILVNMVVRVVPPTVHHVPGPWLVPHDEYTKNMNKEIERPSPSSLTKLIYECFFLNKQANIKHLPRIDSFFLFFFTQLFLVSIFLFLSSLLVFCTSSSCRGVKEFVTECFNPRNSPRGLKMFLSMIILIAINAKAAGIG